MLYCSLTNISRSMKYQENRLGITGSKFDYYTGRHRMTEKSSKLKACENDQLSRIKQVQLLYMSIHLIKWRLNINI